VIVRITAQSGILFIRNRIVAGTTPWRWSGTERSGGPFERQARWRAGLVVILFGNRIVAGTTPWMTTPYTLQSQPSAFTKAVFLQGFYRVLRTGREVSATGRRQGGNILLIPPDQ